MPARIVPVRVRAVPARVLGLVAAAGASGRMGAPKALLSTRLFDTDADDEPWVRRVARAMRDGGATDVVVTVPEDTAVAAAVAVAVADLAITTTNARPAEGLSGSVVAALDAVDGHPRAEAIVICPVDAPGLRAPMVRALVDAIAAGADAAVVVYRGQRGHPVAFHQRCFDALRSAGQTGGPRHVLDSVHVVEVSIDDVDDDGVDDSAVLWDLNSPADIARVRR